MNNKKFIAIPLALLRDRNFILILAFVLGLFVGQAALWVQKLILPALIFIMTLSISNISSRDIPSLSDLTRSLLISLLLNYVVLGGFMLLMAGMLLDDRELWSGFVVIAAVPPAIAVVPFTYLLAGNTTFSLIGMVATYLVAPVVTPALMVLLIGVDSLDPVKLIVMIAELIVIPLILSRILLFTGLTQRIEKWRGTAVNWGFFILVFTVIGLNRPFFFGEPAVLGKIVLIAVATTFLLGAAVEWIAGKLNMRRETSVSLVLMATMKNFGLASGICLTLLGGRAPIPAAIFSACFILYFIWLGFHFDIKDRQ